MSSLIFILLIIAALTNCLMGSLFLSLNLCWSLVKHVCFCNDFASTIAVICMYVCSHNTFPWVLCEYSIFLFPYRVVLVHFMLPVKRDTN